MFFFQNWVGEVTTDDNIDFKIENTKQTITPEEPLGVRFFIQYKANDTIPKLKFIRFNGKEICQVEPEVVERIDTLKDTTTARNYNKQQTTQYWYQTEKQQTTANSLFWTQTTPAPTTKTTKSSQYWTERTTENPRTTQKYWQQTTPTVKPVYWTQAVTEAKAQTTTVRSPGWSYVKAENNQQGTTTVKPTTQVWSRTESTDRNRTVNSQAQSQGQRNQQSSSGNRYQTQSEVTKQTTESPGNIWPTVKVIVNQTVTPKETLPIPEQIVVKQVGHTKYWSKIPTENITGATWSATQDLQNEPYAKVSLRPESTQNNKNTPLYVRPEDKETISGTRYEENRRPARPAVSYDRDTDRQPNTDVVRPVKAPGESWSGEKTSSWSGENYHYIQPGVETSG